MQSTRRPSIRAAVLLHAAAVVHGMSAAMGPGPMTTDPTWMANMAAQVHDALLQAEQLEAAAAVSPTAPAAAAARGGALVREATMKAGELQTGLDRYVASLLPLDFHAGCSISLALDDPSTLDVAFMCVWLEDELARNGTEPNGADMYERLRASRPPHTWERIDRAHTTFAAEYYDGTANTGFYPARWAWLTAGEPSRDARRLSLAPPGRSTNASAPAAGRAPAASANGTHAALPRASPAANASRADDARGVYAIDGLAVTRLMGLFSAGEVGKGCDLFEGLVMPQLRSIPGIVAAASLHDEALQKLLALVVWSGADEQVKGEAMLAEVLNVSVALAPYLREPLISERWPDATLFW
jgi:hypothetical protein